MLKKKIYSSIVLLLALFFLVSCSNKTEITNDINYGQINDSYSYDETADNIFSPFTALDNPFTFPFTTYKNGLAQFQIPIPSDFTSSSDINRILLRGNERIPYFSNTTINIITDTSKAYDEIILNDAVTAFASTLNTLPIYFNNKEYTKVSWDSPDEYKSVSYVSTSSPETILLTVDNNLLLLKGGSIADINTMCCLNYYLCWNNTPTLLSFTDEASNIDNLKSLADYMISNITVYKEDKLSETIIAGGLQDAFNLSFYIPSDFSEHKASLSYPFQNGKRYLVTSNSSKYVGMSINIYTIAKQDFEIIDDNTVIDTLAKSLDINHYYDNPSVNDFNNRYLIEELGSGIMKGCQKDVIYYQLDTLVRKRNGNPSLVKDNSSLISILIFLYDDNCLNIIDITGYENQENEIADIFELITKTIAVK